MFLAQLMLFLGEHHHNIWITQFFSGNRSFQFLYTWAVRHGFTYIP